MSNWTAERHEAMRARMACGSGISDKTVSDMLDEIDRLQRELTAALEDTHHSNGNTDERDAIITELHGLLAERDARLERQSDWARKMLDGIETNATGGAANPEPLPLRSFATRTSLSSCKCRVDLCHRNGAWFAGGNYYCNAHLSENA